MVGCFKNPFATSRKGPQKSSMIRTIGLRIVHATHVQELFEMLDRRPGLTIFRAFFGAVCLLLLMACGPGTLTPLAPVPLNVAASAGNASVTLTWAASTGATSYNVKRSTTNGGPYTQLAGSTTLTYTDSTATNGTTYYYVVTAVNDGGESADSTQASATPQAVKAPTAPTNLAATAGSAQVSLTWTASDGATTYNLKRATTSGGPYTQIASPTATTFTDNSVTNGTKYFYVVSAVNAGGESANSNEVNATPTGAPVTGTWINVTPAGVSPVNCTGGTHSVQADAAHPSNLYAEFDCYGVYKSTDYGMTWTGPINTGTNGASVTDCQGGIAIAPGSTASVPTIFLACIRGGGIGFWKSVDAGVNWTKYNVAPGGNRQDYVQPAIDPHDPNHLIMVGHEFDSTVESTDGGQTWTAVPLNNGMLQNGGSAYGFFIDTGNATTTRTTFLWMGGNAGTWRTTDSGTTWTQVDKNQVPGGTAQIYQPDANGVVYMAGFNSALGSGVLRSSDYGQTWAHVGQIANEEIVTGTPKNVYAMYGQAPNPNFEVASQPGTGQWILPGTPTALLSAAQFAVVNNGTNNILVGAMWASGMWRYVEP
jgi:hypothetical protein